MIFLDRFRKRSKEVKFEMTVEQVQEYTDLRHFANMVMNERSISFVTKQKLKAKIGKDNFSEISGQTIWVGRSK